MKEKNIPDIRIPRDRDMPKMKPVPETDGKRRYASRTDRALHFMRGRWQGFLGGGLLVAGSMVSGGLGLGLQVIGGTLVGNEGKKEIIRKTDKFGQKGEVDDKEFWNTVVRVIIELLKKLLKKS